jgi:hypothetical protein
MASRQVVQTIIMTTPVNATLARITAACTGASSLTATRLKPSSGGSAIPQNTFFEKAPYERLKAMVEPLSRVGNRKSSGRPSCSVATSGPAT